MRTKNGARGQNVPVLSRAIEIVHAVAGERRGATAKALSLSLGIPPATCYRILRTFVEHDWLQENGQGEFSPSLGFFRLAHAGREIDDALRRIEPALRQLTEVTGLSAKISLREGRHVVVAARAEAKRLNAISSSVGAKVHLLESGSVGTVFLSQLSDDERQRILKTGLPEFLPQTDPEGYRREIRKARKEGICRVLGTYHPYIHAMSVPLPLTREVLSVLTIVGWPEDFQKGRRKELEARFRAGAKAIGEALSLPKDAYACPRGAGSEPPGSRLPLRVG